MKFDIIMKKSVVPIEPFEMNRVRLTDGPVKVLMDANRRYMDSIGTDSILHNFRMNAGIPSSAEPLGGWACPTSLIRGHLEGHYLSAVSLLYGSTGDIILKNKVGAIVSGLAMCQAKLGGGYLSAFPESLFNDLDAGKPVLVPWYVIHKIMAGLYDASIHCGNTQAYGILLGMADWVKGRLDRLSDEQLEVILKTEYGGMNEVLYNLFSISGRKNDLECAHRFQEVSLYDPLAKCTDNLNGLHGNTAIAKIQGASRRYELEKDDYYKNIVVNAWDYIVNHRAYVTGGSTCGECWGQSDKLSGSLSKHNEESCVSYNSLKLTRNLFTWTGEVRYADYYERTLFNAIIGTMNPEDGMKMYYMPLGSGYFKHFHTPKDNMWCCTGSGMESFSKLTDSIYFHDMDSVYVNLFISSTLDWTEKGVMIEQSAELPESDSVALTVSTPVPVRFEMKIRIPYWVEGRIKVIINGIIKAVSSEPSSYLILDRQWSDNDKVDITFPMGFHVSPLQDDPQTVAFMYGPVVLAGLMGERDMYPNSTGNFMSMASRPELEEAPELKSDLMCDTRHPYSILENPGLWFKQVDNQPCTFTLSDGNRTIKFKPLNQVFNQRYTVYWNIVPIQGENISRRKPVITSSAYLHLSNGKDFDWNTAGGSKGTVDTAVMAQRLQVDLEQHYDVTRCETYFRNPDAIYRYIIEYSSDGVSWKVYKDRWYSCEEEKPCYIDNNYVTARYMRITVSEPEDKQTCILEFNVYSVPLSIKCSASSSSAYQDFSADKAVDGDPGTCWTADSGYFSQWLSVDLGQNYIIKKCRTFFEFTDRYYQYLIEYSTNNVFWYKFADRRDNKEAGKPCHMDAGDVTARFMRITVTGVQDHTLRACIAEFKVYGESIPVSLGKVVAALSVNQYLHAIYADGEGVSFPIKREVDMEGVHKGLLVDLEKNHYITMCKTYFNTPGKWHNYIIEYSLDNVNWEIYMDKTNNCSMGNPYIDINHVTARFMKVTADGIEKEHSSINDFEVYGVPMTPISRHKAATASSMLVEGNKIYSPNLACDGSVTGESRWAADGAAMPQWLQIDLGDSYNITDCETFYEYPDKGYKYKIESSMDGITWEIFADRTENAVPSGENLCYNDCGSITAQYMRITTTGSQDDVRASLWEFNVYGTSVGVSHGKAATASSTCSIYAAGNAVDGDISFQSRWSADGEALPQWLQVDLGSYFDISCCETYFEYTGKWYRYMIEYSTDAVNWMLYADRRVNTAPANPYYTDCNGTIQNITARHMRITVTGTEQGGACIRELKVLGRQAPLSLKMSAAASSEHDVFYMGDKFANRAFDGDMSTLWTAVDSSFPQWLQVDLGQECSVRTCETYFEKNNHWYKYKIAYSTDGVKWDVFADKTENMKLMGKYYLDNNNVTARYMRITVTGAQDGWASIYEFKVFA